MLSNSPRFSRILAEQESRAVHPSEMRLSTTAGTQHSKMNRLFITHIWTNGLKWAAPLRPHHRCGVYFCTAQFSPQHNKTAPLLSKVALSTHCEMLDILKYIYPTVTDACFLSLTTGSLDRIVIAHHDAYECGDIAWHTLTYRGADRSLAWPGKKQATATEDFDVHTSNL
jgi:hypothetical protein